MRRAAQQGCLSAARRLAGDRRGTAAVMFALAMVAMVPVALGMFDIYLSLSQRTKLQDALDSAALYAARSAARDPEEVAAIGQRALAANLRLMEGSSLVASEFRLEDNMVFASAEASPSSLAPGLFVRNNLVARTEVVRSTDKLEIAIVLDNTGSMQGTKLTTLKTAARDLVDTLTAAAERSPDPDAVKIALVPFSNTVRVTPSVNLDHYDPIHHQGPGVPDWIDTDGRAHSPDTLDTFAARTDRLGALKNMGLEWAGCVESRRPPYDIVDDGPVTTVRSSYFVPYFWPDEPDAADGFNGYLNDYIDDRHNSGQWKVRQRHEQKYLATGVRPKAGRMNLNSAYGGPYDFGPNAGCVLEPIVRLTTNATELKRAISAMTAVGETNIAMGLMWGWHAVSPNAPLADGSAYDTPKTKKVIILMTDGENTFNVQAGGNRSMYGGLGYIWQNLLPGASSNSSAAQRTSAMDARLRTLCENVKAKDITLYTVRVEVRSGDSALLRNCASRTDMFYDVQNVSQLNAVFQAIAGSIDDLRLSR